MTIRCVKPLAEPGMTPRRARYRERPPDLPGNVDGASEVDIPAAFWCLRLCYYEALILVPFKRVLFLALRTASRFCLIPSSSPAYVCAETLAVRAWQRFCWHYALSVIVFNMLGLYAWQAPQSSCTFIICVARGTQFIFIVSRCYSPRKFASSFIERRGASSMDGE